jgi:hypothetical protein
VARAKKGFKDIGLAKKRRQRILKYATRHFLVNPQYLNPFFVRSSKFMGYSG